VREQRVLQKRFGIGEKSEHTLEEIGKEFNVTRERIRQIEAKALQKLKSSRRSRSLRYYVEGGARTSARLLRGPSRRSSVLSVRAYARGLLPSVGPLATPI
jgi:hypothetical protein